MPLKNNSKSTTVNSTDKKGAVNGISNVLDDAPLFAGLDDYNLQQTVRMDVRATKAGQVKEIKELVPQQTNQAAPQKSPANRAPKVQKTTLADPNSMLLSVTEICTLLKISRATLVRMDKSGQLPGRIKLGGSVRFHRETVETWLKSLIGTNHASS